MEVIQADPVIKNIVYAEQVSWGECLGNHGNPSSGIYEVTSNALLPLLAPKFDHKLPTCE